MTGTAATQAGELRDVYGLEVEVIPTNRPMIRIDHPDVLYNTKAEKEAGLLRKFGKFMRPASRSWSGLRVSKTRSA
jgi:preprotein translocase subunit SecA